MAFSVKTTFVRDVAKLRLAKSELPDAQKAGMRAVGVQVAAWAVQDYRRRSNGQTAGGVSWRAITRSAAASRLAKRAPWRSITASLERLSASEADLKEELRRKMPKAGTAKQRGAIAHAFEKKNPVLKANRKRRAALRTKRKRLIDREHSAARIGVDTGRLVNSLVFGEPALRTAGAQKMKPGTPAPPKATFSVREDSVTLGTNLSYARGFDKLRPIFSPNMIDSTRAKELEELYADVQEEVVRKATRGGPQT